MARTALKPISVLGEILCPAEGLAACSALCALLRPRAKPKAKEKGTLLRWPQWRKLLSSAYRPGNVQTSTVTLLQVQGVRLQSDDTHAA
jgi:hypothetical protein